MLKRKKEERGRFTVRRKVEAVMRLLKGEDLDTVSRERRFKSCLRRSRFNAFSFRLSMFLGDTLSVGWRVGGIGLENPNLDDIAGTQAGGFSSPFAITTVSCGRSRPASRRAA
jgi:hypothetical protein